LRVVNHFWELAPYVSGLAQEKQNGIIANALLVRRMYSDRQKKHFYHWVKNTINFWRTTNIRREICGIANKKKKDEMTFVDSNEIIARIDS